MLIVITGVTRGLGRSLAEWYIAHGHTVAGCGRSAEILELRFTYPAPHDFAVVDVTDENKVALWAEKVCGPDVAPRPADLQRSGDERSGAALEGAGGRVQPADRRER